MLHILTLHITSNESRVMNLTIDFVDVDVDFNVLPP